MIKKIILCLLVLQVCSVHANASSPSIEIFDVQKGKVTRKVEAHPAIQRDAKTYLAGITGIYGEMDPIPKRGFMVKVPLAPNVMVKNEWLHALVDEMIIIFSGEEEPYILIFDEENRPYFLTCKGNTVELLIKLNGGPYLGF
ncbi:MAG: hypothetical protein ACI35R_06325 [Bacillus sp. (in: firmicutes)]